MLNVKKIVEEIENGLNLELAKERGNELLEFKIHLGAGWKNDSENDENNNEVREYIDCGVTALATAPVGVNANIGALSFNILFYVPLFDPKTTEGQTIEDYDEKEAVYPFYNKIYKLLQNYFLQPRIVEFENSDGERMHYSYTSGVAEDAIIDMHKIVVGAFSGTYSDGDLSTEIEVLFDGERVPQKTVSPASVGTKETDVVTENIKAFLTSYATSLSIAIPSRYDKISIAVKNRVFLKKINEPHFITIHWGDIITHYLVILESVTPTTEGNNTASFNCEFVEATAITSLLNIASDFQLKYKTFTTSDGRTLKVTTSKDCYVYVNGTAYYLEKGKEITTKINSTDYELNANKEYAVGVIASDKTADITITEV